MPRPLRHLARRVLTARRAIDSYRLDTVIGRSGTDLIQVGALFVAFSRGIDYIRLPGEVSVSTLSVVERALALDTWGWIFLSVSVIGYAGLFIPRLPVTAIMHGLLVAVYVMFAIGALADVANRDTFYGWRIAIGWLFGAAIVHLVLSDSSKDAWRRAGAD